MKLLSPPVTLSRPAFARLLGGLLAFSILSGAASALAAEDAREIVVDLDYARVVKIPAGAHTLVIGNPLIADVTMLKNNQLMVITGKSFGTTNLIVLDRAGAQVGESIVTVVPARSGPTVWHTAFVQSPTPAVSVICDGTAIGPWLPVDVRSNL